MWFFSPQPYFSCDVTFKHGGYWFHHDKSVLSTFKCFVIDWKVHCRNCLPSLFSQLWRWIAETGVGICVMSPDCRPNNCYKLPSLHHCPYLKKKKLLVRDSPEIHGNPELGLACQLSFILMDEDRKKNSVLNVYRLSLAQRAFINTTQKWSNGNPLVFVRQQMHFHVVSDSHWRIEKQFFAFQSTKLSLESVPLFTAICAECS